MCVEPGCKLPAAPGGRYPDGLCERHADEWCDRHPQLDPLKVRKQVILERLAKAVAQWIATEDHWRNGEHPFSCLATQKLREAEGRVRKALTGVKDPKGAYEALGKLQ